MRMVSRSWQNCLEGPQNCPQGRGFCLFFVPRGRNFVKIFCPGAGNLTALKNSPGVSPGGGHVGAWNSLMHKERKCLITEYFMRILRFCIPAEIAAFSNNFIKTNSLHVSFSIKSMLPDIVLIHNKWETYKIHNHDSDLKHDLTLEIKHFALECKDFTQQLRLSLNFGHK